MNIETQILDLIAKLYNHNTTKEAEPTLEQLRIPIENPKPQVQKEKDRSYKIVIDI